MADPKLGPNRGNAGKGRPKGVPNKASKALKDAILGALERAGGEDYLLAIAKDDPRTFATLLGKVLPMQVVGDAANPLQHVHRIERTIVDPADTNS